MVLVNFLSYDDNCMYLKCLEFNLKKMNYQKNIETFCLFLRKFNVYELAPEVYDASFLLASNLTDLTPADEYGLSQRNRSYEMFDCDLATEEEFNDDVTERSYVRHSLAKYVYPFMLFLGIIGNMASFLAMAKKHKSEKRSQRQSVHIFSICLSILCLADITILLVGGLNEYMEQVFGYSMRSSSVFACKFFYFVCYLINSFIAHLFAYIATDRWQAAAYPIKYKQKQTSHRHRIHICAIFVYCMVVCGPFFYFPTLYAVQTTRRSDLENKCILEIRLFKELTLLDAVVLSFAPFVVTLVFSVLTLVALFKERRALIAKKGQPYETTYSSRKHHVANSSNITWKMSSTRRISRLKLALGLMMLPVSYLVSTLPVFVIISLQLVAPYIRHDLHFEDEFAVANMIMYANNSFNILFFILLGKRLRNELLGIFRCSKKLTHISYERTEARGRKWRLTI